MSKRKRRDQCVLCKEWFKKNEMSEEHYPAKTVGNVDIVKVNVQNMLDIEKASSSVIKIKKLIELGMTYDEALDEIFQKEYVEEAYYQGRTIRTLCRKCNTLLGQYDFSYKNFFEKDGDPNLIKGFQKHTKIEIIKSIYGKFLSIPECKDENFDFLDFIRIVDLERYSGEWKLYVVKRGFDTDIMNMKSINTGVIHLEEGTIYEFSDDKFIFHLMNFACHPSEQEMSFWDILKKKYEFIPVSKTTGGYHGMLLISQALDGFPDF